MVLPECVRTNFKIRMRFGLVPKHLVLDIVTLGIVENHQAFVVLSALVHHLAENFECRKHPGVTLVDTLTVGHDVFSQNEYVIDVRP